MKRMALAALLGFVMFQSLFAGGQGQGGARVSRYHIGIAKFVQYDAHDLCERGIKDALAARGIKADYDLQNAEGDLSAASRIADKFKFDGVDIAIGLSTPMAVALANVIKVTPVVFTSVTDPVGAKLVKTLAHGQRNVTGISDAVPIADHIALFKEIAGISTLGYIYSEFEVNSISALAQVEEACRAQGLTLVAWGIDTPEDMIQAAEALVTQVDGMYLTSDNTVFAALPSLVQVFREAKKPIFSADVTGAMSGGCMIAAGYDYYKAGRATGNMAADILEGKRRPANTPVKLLTELSELDLLFDLDAASNCGITIPPRHITKANYLFLNGRLNIK